jgi:RNA polymerase sigma-70 factor (ECF subfamily)
MASNPAARYDLRESVQLAFIATGQLLPPRQRAALLLCDVLGWSVSEVAPMLETSVPAVTSALQRARASLQRQRTAGLLSEERVIAPREVEATLVHRFVSAWEAVDIAGIVALLKEDAALTMPPQSLRFLGRAAIATFFATVPAGGALDQIRLLPTRANRQPAVAAYLLDAPSQTYHAYGLMVLSLDGGAIAGITGFADSSLFPSFNLPSQLKKKEE